MREPCFETTSSLILESRPFPHFEPCQDEAGIVVRIDEDGTRTRTRTRFINRTFVAAK